MSVSEFQGIENNENFSECAVRGSSLDEIMECNDLATEITNRWFTIDTCRNIKDILAL